MGFLQRNQANKWGEMTKKNTGENRSEKAQETTKKRRPEGDRKMDQSPWPMVAGDHGPRSPAPWTMGAWSPATMGAWSPATLEIRVPGFPPKRPFFRFFSRFAMLAPVIFLKSDFWGMISVDLLQHHGSAIEIIWSSDTPKLPTGRPRKHTFCPTDQEIDWIDVAGPLVGTNVWIFIIIRHQATYGSIDDHRKKNSKRRGAARDSSSDSAAN